MAEGREHSPEEIAEIEKSRINDPEKVHLMAGESKQYRDHAAYLRKTGTDEEHAKHEDRFADSVENDVAAAYDLEKKHTLEELQRLIDECKEKLREYKEKNDYNKISETEEKIHLLSLAIMIKKGEIPSKERPEEGVSSK